MPRVYSDVKNKLRKVWHHNKLTTSNCPERTKSRYQPGGTATLITNRVTQKVHDSGADQFGRWSFITLDGTHKRKMTVVMAYRVCKNTLAMAGENTCWMQQWRSLCKQGMEEPDPRHQFMTDFETFLKDHLNKNEEIIVEMDINEEDLPKTEIKQLMWWLDMIDVHCHLHSEAKAPSTYQRGKN
eukprot:5948881-Ditylum_brightwellii.AAC.1